MKESKEVAIWKMFLAGSEICLNEEGKL